ncbi:MAG: tetratricopeptide repeat protein [Pyrinomonadaceae bacterium]|nr:tetratricopeptide repeat protein [Pyrinomonadaceae bacterium]
MSQSRIEIFEAMARSQPDDVMVWYGLGSEYYKAENWAKAAEALRRVIEINPDYTAAYQMLGTALMNQGAREEAQRAWREGIKTADRTGAWKARQHMEGLLGGASDESGTGLCKE